MFTRGTHPRKCPLDLHRVRSRAAHTHANAPSTSTESVHARTQQFPEARGDDAVDQEVDAGVEQGQHAARIHHDVVTGDVAHVARLLARVERQSDRHGHGVGQETGQRDHHHGDGQATSQSVPASLLGRRWRCRRRGLDADGGGTGGGRAAPRTSRPAVSTNPPHGQSVADEKNKRRDAVGEKIKHVVRSVEVDDVKQTLTLSASHMAHVPGRFQ